MKRLLTAILILAVVLFLGASGERKTADTAEKLCEQAQELKRMCEQFDRKSERLRAEIDELREEWNRDSRTLTLYMNARNLRPVTQALRDMADAAGERDVTKIKSAASALGDAARDLMDSEKLSLYNVF